MKYIDLFAGIGGFRLGLDRTGHTCVWTNEWLQKPASIYERNFKNKPDTSDIRTITADSIPDADLIVGGFPCATFSIAGKRLGFSLEDTRGTLCFEMFRLAKDKGIPYILFENVKGLLNHDGGRTFHVILCALDEMGYDAQWELIDSQNFGVPQHRERIFVIANHRKSPRPKVFPLTIPSREDGIPNTQEQKEGAGVQTTSDKKFAIPTLLNRLYGGDSNNPYIEQAVSETLDANYAKGSSTRRYLEVPQEQNGLVKMHMRSHTMANMKQKEQVRDSTWTLDTSPQNKMAVDTGFGYRKLTPLECERLQGLPDNFTKYYADGTLVSDSERYERCGRTVSVPVIEEIGKRLHEFY